MGRVRRRTRRRTSCAPPTRRPRPRWRTTRRSRALPEDDPRRRAAQARLERWLGYGDKDIERHREELDSITDTIAMVGAITVGIAVTVALRRHRRRGAARRATSAPSTTVVAAGVGAIAAAAASMPIKEQHEGRGLRRRGDRRRPRAQAPRTRSSWSRPPGVGEAAIQALGRTPAFAVLARAAEGGMLSQLAVKGAGSGVEGLIQGLPTGMMSAILNENTWRSANPLARDPRGGRQDRAPHRGDDGRHERRHPRHRRRRSAAWARPADGPGEPPERPEPLDLDAVHNDDASSTSERRARRGRRPRASEGGRRSRSCPITMLWDGSIVHRNPPFTAAEADAVYINTIADSAAAARRRSG